LQPATCNLQPMKRIFSAIKLHPSPALLEIFRFLKQNLNTEKIKWVEEHNLHFTLKFFGEIPEEEIPAIRQALKNTAQHSHAFDIELRGTGIFGSSYNPRVIWFGIEPNAAMQSLYETMWIELSRLGYVPDSQNFVPHLTIGRVKFIGNKRFFQEVINRYKDEFIQKETIKELYLFESILRPEGPQYKIIESLVFSS
jgi:2'-5' RNA ligase